MLHNWPTSDVLFLFIEKISLDNFSQHHQIRQCLIIDQHPMSLFASYRSDYWTISLSIITFANVSWLTNIQCPFSLHRDEIIEHFPSASSHSPMFDNWPTSDVLFLFIQMRPLNNLSYHHNIRQCFMTDQHPMSFFSTPRSDHWKPLSASSHSPMLHDWPTTDVLLVFNEIRSLNNFSHNHHIR